MFKIGRSTTYLSLGPILVVPTENIDSLGLTNTFPPVNQNIRWNWQWSFRAGPVRTGQIHTVSRWNPTSQYNWPVLPVLWIAWVATELDAQDESNAAGSIPVVMSADSCTVLVYSSLEKDPSLVQICPIIHGTLTLCAIREIWQSRRKMNVVEWLHKDIVS